MGRDSKFGAFVLILVLGFIVAAGGAAVAEGAEPVTYFNEATTVDYSAEYSVAETGVNYRDDVTVRDKNLDALNRGVDYEWDDDDGNVTWLDTAATTDGEEAYVTYTVEQVTDESTQLADLVSIFVLPLALLITLILGAGPLKAVIS